MILEDGDKVVKQTSRIPKNQTSPHHDQSGNTSSSHSKMLLSTKGDARHTSTPLKTALAKIQFGDDIGADNMLGGDSGYLTSPSELREQHARVDIIEDSEDVAGHKSRKFRAQKSTQHAVMMANLEVSPRSELNNLSNSPRIHEGLTKLKPGKDSKEMLDELKF